MDMGTTLSGFFNGTFGTSLFIYGKKQQKLSSLFGGIVLCGLPVVTTSLLPLWSLTAACIGGVWFLCRNE